MIEATMAGRQDEGGSERGRQGRSQRGMSLRREVTWPCLSLKATLLGALQGEGTSWENSYNSTQMRAEVAVAGVVPAETVRMNRVGGNIDKLLSPGPLLV